MELIKINGTEIQAIEYQNERVVTFKQIDAVHQRKEGTARDRFKYQKKRFIPNKHFYHIDYTQKGEFHPLGIDIPPRGLNLITERGYMMLVKSFNDDLAWEVQDKLVDGYFRGKKQEPELKPMTLAEQLLESVKISIELEKKQAEHEDRLSLIETRYQRAEDNLIYFPRAKVEAEEISPRLRVSKWVRNFCDATNIPHNKAWKIIYSDYNYRYRTNLRLRQKNILKREGKKIKFIDLIEQDDRIEELYAIAQDLLIIPTPKELEVM